MGEGFWRRKYYEWFQFSTALITAFSVIIGFLVIALVLALR